MNINCKVSEKLYRFERHYQKENLGKSQYLIIKREENGSPLGLFAYYITNIAWIEYALRKGFIPVIDMQNFENSLHRKGQVGKVNTYEYFFKQPCGVGLKEAVDSKKARYVWNDIPDFHPNESLDFLVYQELVEYYRKLAREYMPFQDSVKDHLEKSVESILGRRNEEKGIRTLGVLARGTDYVTLKPYFHPVQPSIEEIVEKIDAYRIKYDCKKIYVATEDSGILKKLKEKYGEDLCYNDQKRIQNTDTFLNYNEEFTKTDPYKRGLDYLTSIYVLSRCTGLIAGRTSGTVGAVLMAENYEFQYIFSKGRYGVEEEILGRKLI